MKSIDGGTLRDERGQYEICSVCFWEDDGQDDHDAVRVRGGPNRGLSLLDGPRNFAAHGASDPKDIGHVQPPLPEEHPLTEHGRLSWPEAVAVAGCEHRRRYRHEAGPHTADNVAPEHDPAPSRGIGRRVPPNS